MKLKIKDDVDLKELKKFNFILETYLDFEVYRQDSNYCTIFIEPSNRIIKCAIDKSKVIVEVPNEIFDLIKADIVEKVEG